MAMPPDEKFHWEIPLFPIVLIVAIICVSAIAIVKTIWGGACP